MFDPNVMNNPKTADITNLVAIINHFHPVSNDVIDYLRRHSSSRSVRRGTTLLRAGDICEHIYFVNQGAIRGFINDGQRDITTWISAENELVTSIYSLDQDVPALENIQAIEDCNLVCLTNKAVQDLYTLYPEFNIVGRKLLQQYYKDAEGRAYIVRISKAEQKYQHFIQQYSHLANRIPLKFIASYLGITLETLSRVRRKISVGA